MGGTIVYDEKEKLRQENSDLRGENKELRYALEKIIRANGQKSRKIAIDKAKEILWPKREEVNENSWLKWPLWTRWK